VQYQLKHVATGNVSDIVALKKNGAVKVVG